jgi:hypothetical protein
LVTNILFITLFSLVISIVSIVSIVIIVIIGIRAGNALGSTPPCVPTPPHQPQRR